MSKFDILLLSEKNIFNIDDLSALWKQTKRVETVWSIKQYVKSGKIHRLRRGLYIIDNSKLDSYILANKALTPSYITGLTVLQKYGLSFQSTNTIHSGTAQHATAGLCIWQLRPAKANGSSRLQITCMIK